MAWTIIEFLKNVCSSVYTKLTQGMLSTSTRATSPSSAETKHRTALARPRYTESFSATCCPDEWIYMYTQILHIGILVIVNIVYQKRFGSFIV